MYDGPSLTYQRAELGAYCSTVVAQFLVPTLAALTAGISINENTSEFGRTMTTYVMPIVTCSLGLSFAICEVVKACAKKRVIAKTEKKVSDFFKTYHELDLENKAIHFATDSTPKEIMDLVKDGILSRKLKRI